MPRLTKKSWYRQSRRALYNKARTTPFKRSYLTNRYLHFETLEVRLALSVSAYTIDLVTTSGGIVSSLGASPSINDDGTVAFTKYFSTGGKGIFVASPGNTPRNITPSYETNFSAAQTFREPVQINNSGLVVNTQQVQLSRNVNVWNSNADDSLNTQIAHAFGTTGSSLFTALAFDSIANDGSVVFVGRPGPSASGSVVIYRGQIGASDSYAQIALPNQIPTPLSLMPMIANGGSVVLRYGANSTDPIVLVDPILGPLEVAGPGNGFGAVGAAPGISDDANVIAFYGSLNGSSSSAGPAIWLVDVAQVQGLQVAAANSGGDGVLKPWETYNDLNGNGVFDSATEIDVSMFTSFSTDSRVAVNGTIDDIQGVTAAFIAYNTSNAQGLYTVNITQDASSPSGYRVSSPKLVADTGTTLPGIGNATEFRIYDPVNIKGQIAFWATNGTTQAIFRTHAPAIYVLTVGVIDEPSNHGGHISAARVASAFDRLDRVANANVVNISLNTQNAGSNLALLSAAITNIEARLSPTDLFVFYINAHGYYDLFGPEPLVEAASLDDVPDGPRVLTTGDERLYLSQNNAADNISDDELADLFRSSTWNGTNKLFIISSCFSGGFWGPQDDLMSLPQSAIIADAPETEYSQAISNSGYYTGKLGLAVAAALNAFPATATFSYQELFNRIDLEGKLLSGSGRIQVPYDGWAEPVTLPFQAVTFSSASFGFPLAPTTPPPLLGDYDRNGDVNAADYIVWRQTLTNSITPYDGADGSGNGLVDQSDFAVWKSQFGKTQSAISANTSGVEHAITLSVTHLATQRLGNASTTSQIEDVSTNPLNVVVSPYNEQSHIERVTVRTFGDEFSKLAGGLEIGPPRSHQVNNAKQFTASYRASDLLSLLVTQRRGELAAYSSESTYLIQEAISDCGNYAAAVDEYLTDSDSMQFAMRIGSSLPRLK